MLDQGYGGGENYGIGDGSLSVGRLQALDVLFTNLGEVDLNSGGGADVVTLNGVPSDLTLDLNEGGGFDEVVVAAGTVSLPQDELDSVEELTVSGGQVDVGADLTLQVLVLSGGTVDGTGTVTVTGEMDWTGGTMSGSGTAQVAGGGLLLVSGTDAKVLDGWTLANAGTATWSGGAITGTAGCIVNLAGGTFAAGGTLDGSFENRGRLTVGGDNAAGALAVGSDFTQTSDGTLVAEYGDLVSVGGTVSVAGALDPGSVSAAGVESYTIIENLGSAAIAGTFAGLPDRAGISVAGQPFQITYFGADGLTGNDVVLEAPATRFAIDLPASVAAGSPFEITVAAENAFGHTAVLFTGPVHLSIADTWPYHVLPADYTFLPADQGAYTFTGVVLDTADPRHVTATADQASPLPDPITGSADIVVNPVATSLNLVTGNANAVYGDAITLTASISPNDLTTPAGTTHPTGTVTFQKVIPGDSPTYVTVGSAPLVNGTATLQLVSANSGPYLDAGTYTYRAVFSSADITFTDSTSDTINQVVTPKSLSVSPTGTVEKVYDGMDTANVAAANYSFTGLLSGDSVTVSCTGSNYDDKNAGQSKTVYVHGLSLGGADADNYQLTSTDISGPVGSIAAKSLSVSLTGTVEKVYDGTDAANVAADNYSLNGLLSGDAVTVSSTSSTYDDKNAGENKSVSVHGLSLGGTDGANYQLTSTDISGTVGTITAKSLSISLAGTVEKVYDGTDTATVAARNYSLDGLVAGDSITFSNTGSTYEDKNVGVNKAVTAGGLSLGGTDANNYQLASTSASGNVGTITPRTLYAALVGTVQKVYDGNTDAALAPENYGLNGLLAGDEAFLNCPAGGSYENKDAGSGKIVQVDGLALSGADTDNYQLATTTIYGPVGDITRAPLTPGLTGAVQKVYDGSTAATLAAGNYTLGGTILGDAVALNNPSSGTYDTKNAGTGKDVTVSSLALTGADAGNYQLSTDTLTAAVGVIDKATLTVTADDKTMTQGGTVPTLTATITGFVNGESLADISGSPALSTTATSQSPFGTYAITAAAGTLSAANYAFTFHSGTLTINPVSPVAHDDSYVAPMGSWTITISPGAPGVLGNDTHAGGTTLTAVLVAGPQYGTLQLNADGSFTYTATPQSLPFNDSFTYKVFDGYTYSNVATVTLRKPQCFPAGTPVATPDGLKPIEQVRAADQVWGYDLVAGEWQPGRVVETYAHDYRGDLVSITVGGEVIEATDTHPFWVIEGEGLARRARPDHVPATVPGARLTGRWVDAGHLRVGDVLLAQPDRPVTVSRLSVREVAQKVYNFQVAEIHSYAVGQTRVLVHNK